MTDSAASGWTQYFLPRPVPAGTVDDRLDWAKLTAILLMAANHTLLAFPPPLDHWGHWIGRACIPIFVYIIVARLAGRPPERATAMLVRLLMWAIIAQPIYGLLIGGQFLRLNVLFTLAGGVLMMASAARQRYLVATITLCAMLLADPWLDGGVLTGLAIFVGATFWARSPAAALFAVVGVTTVHNALLDPSDWPAIVSTLLAAPIILASRGLPPAPFRIPGVVFYGFYPAHLLAIWLVLGSYGWT